MMVYPPGETADFGGSPSIGRGEIVVYRASVEVVFLDFVFSMMGNGIVAGF
jgi:hypothetical protein